MWKVTRQRNKSVDCILNNLSYVEDLDQCPIPLATTDVHHRYQSIVFKGRNWSELPLFVRARACPSAVGSPSEESAAVSCSPTRPGSLPGTGSTGKRTRAKPPPWCRSSEFCSATRKSTLFSKNFNRRTPLYCTTCVHYGGSRTYDVDGQNTRRCLLPQIGAVSQS